jgi:hypothetical protein
MKTGQRICGEIGREGGFLACFVKKKEEEKERTKKKKKDRP